MSEVTQEVAETIAPSESELANQTEQNTPEVTAAEGEVEQKEQVTEERKFTQAELDAAIQKRLAKEERRRTRELEQKLEQMRQQQALKTPERDEFASDEKYQEALIEHEAERRAQAKLAEREAKERKERIATTFQERAEKVAERYEDFEAVVFNPSTPISDPMAEFIAESDIGPELAYHLGKNPRKAAEIFSMSPVKAARELTRIEAELAAQPKATPSKAPEPISPVGSRGKSTASAAPSDDDDIETWMRKEAERQRKRG